MESDEDQVFKKCEVCDLPFRGVEPFEQHIKDPMHKKQVKDKKRQSQVKSLDGDKELTPEENKDTDNAHTSEICETAFSGMAPYPQDPESGPQVKTFLSKGAEDDPTELNDNGSSEIQTKNVADRSEIIKKEIVPDVYGACFICEKQFNAPDDYSQHMRSKSHVKRQTELLHLKREKALSKDHNQIRQDSAKKFVDDEKQEDLERNDTAKVFPGEKQEDLERDTVKVFPGDASCAQHLTSKAHTKIQGQNTLQEEWTETQEWEGDSSSSGGQESSEVLACKICKKTLSGPESVKAHFKSKLHKKAVRRKKYLAKHFKRIERKTKIKPTTTDATGSFSVNSDHTDENKLLENPGCNSADVLGEEPSAPQLSDYDQVCQNDNGKIDSKNLDQNEERNSSSTAAANKDSNPKGSVFLGDFYDIETQNVSGGRSVMPVDETADSEIQPIQKIQTPGSSNHMK